MIPMFLVTAIYLATISYINVGMYRHHYIMNKKVAKHNILLMSILVLIFVGLMCCLWYFSKPYLLISPGITWTLLIIDFLVAIVTIYFFGLSARKGSKN